MAGHADLATTERYADMVASDLRSAVDLFGATAGQQPKRESEGAS